MSAGYSGTPLARKLGIGDGQRLALIGAPEAFESMLSLPASVRCDRDPPAPEGFVRSHDVVVVFARDMAELRSRFDGAQRLLGWDGGLWVAWPKASSPLATDLGKMDVQHLGLSAGLVDNKVCAVDEDWSGLRFVYRREDRPGTARRAKGPRRS